MKFLYISQGFDKFESSFSLGFEIVLSHPKNLLYSIFEILNFIGYWIWSSDRIIYQEILNQLDAFNWWFIFNSESLDRSKINKFISFGFYFSFSFRVPNGEEINTNIRSDTGSFKSGLRLMNKWKIYPPLSLKTIIACIDRLWLHEQPHLNHLHNDTGGIF